MTERRETRERNGVRIGQRVRDMEGKSLGRVDALYEASFSVTGGLPLLFRRDFVAGYEEVRELRGDEVVLARSSRDLFSLARGELPPSWRPPSTATGPAAWKAPAPAPAAARAAPAAPAAPHAESGSVAPAASPAADRSR